MPLCLSYKLQKICQFLYKCNLITRFLLKYLTSKNILDDKFALIN